MTRSAIEPCGAGTGGLPREASSFRAADVAEPAISRSAENGCTVEKVPLPLEGVVGPLRAARSAGENSAGELPGVTSDVGVADVTMAPPP